MSSVISNSSNLLFSEVAFRQNILKPKISDGWQWLNNNGASLAETERGIEFEFSPIDGVMGIILPEPQVPYSVEALVIYDAVGGWDFVGAGIGRYDSGSGKIEIDSLTTKAKKFEVTRWDNYNTYNSTPYGMEFIHSFGNFFWTKIENDGANLTWYISQNGYKYFTLAKHSVTEWLPNSTHIIFGAHPHDASGNKMYVTFSSFEIIK